MPSGQIYHRMHSVIDNPDTQFRSRSEVAELVHDGDVSLAVIDAEAWERKKEVHVVLT